MHTWACLLTNYPIQFICFENRQTDQKPVQILSTRPSQYLPAQSNSKLPGTRPIWQHCTVHCSATKQAGALTPRLHALSVE